MDYERYNEENYTTKTDECRDKALWERILADGEDRGAWDEGKYGVKETAVSRYLMDGCLYAVHYIQDEVEVEETYENLVGIVKYDGFKDDSDASDERNRRACYRIQIHRGVNMQYGIFNKATGKLDCDPEPMVFDTYNEAVDALNATGVYADSSEWYVDGVAYDPEKKSSSRVCTIRADGSSSYKVTITEQVRELGLDIGDQARITISKLE